MKMFAPGLGAVTALAAIAVPSHAQSLAFFITDQLHSTQATIGSNDDGTDASSQYIGGISVDTFAFEVTEVSTVQIDVLSYDAFPTYFDSFLRLYEDDGQPLSAANFVASNDDATVGSDRNGSTRSLDSFLELTLQPGRYIVAVGAFNLGNTEADAGFSDGLLVAPTGTPTPIDTGAYQLDIFGDFVMGTIENGTTHDRHFTIADAVATSSKNDTLFLFASRYSESGIQFNDADVDIVGNGPDNTLILGQLAGDRIFSHDSQDQSAVSGLTLAQGRSDQGATNGGAVSSRGFVSYSNVVMRDNQGSSISSSISVRDGRLSLDRCIVESGVVDPGGTRSGIFVGFGGAFEAVNSVFATGDVNALLFAQNADTTVEFTNCTVVDGGFGAGGIQMTTGSSAIITNCVFDAAVASFATGDVTATRNLYPGLTGDNFDAAPNFVDAANGDFRLTADSPGIDAGDFDAYSDAGGEGLLDIAGNLRFNDVPGVANFSSPFAIDLGAFEAAPDALASTCPGDLTGDNAVNADDLLQVLGNFGQTCP